MQELNLQDILKNTADLKEKKVWYVAIVGRPNVGKSTFINTLVGEKIAIVSNIPQTTRNKILAVYNDDDAQIVFLDTPGIHKSNKVFNEQINNQATGTLEEADLVLYFLDTSRPLWEEEKFIKELLSHIKTPIVKVYTKSDLRTELQYDSENTHTISSLTREWYPQLLKEIKSHLKEDMMLFGDDIYTNQNLRFRISEIIREKIFLNTKQELPHSTFVQVEEIKEEPKMYRIVAYIYTETESQKYIVIGKWWNLLTRIWKQARIELEKMLDKKVFLAVRVKVKKWWKKDEDFIKKMLN